MSLSRQAEELSALAAMYCGDGETFTIEEEDASGELCCRLSLHDGAASLGAALPGDYPTLVPPRLTVSCPSLSAAESRALFASLVEIAADGAAADREILFEVCQAFQERMAELLATPDAPVEEVHQPAPAEQQGRAAFLVWFHHIKSMSKRKDIVGWARDGGLRGFCKPGFPGVVAVEGEAAACAEYVARLRELRWQAMEVRWEARLDEGAPELCEPFVELAESAMGEAAALCEAAGLLGPFRSAVLKLGPSRVT